MCEVAVVARLDATSEISLAYRRGKFVTVSCRSKSTREIWNGSLLYPEKSTNGWFWIILCQRSLLPKSPGKTQRFPDRNLRIWWAYTFVHPHYPEHVPLLLRCASVDGCASGRVCVLCRGVWFSTCARVCVRVCVYREQNTHMHARMHICIHINIHQRSQTRTCQHSMWPN